MKKILTLLLAAVLVFGFAACGDKPEASKEADVATKEETPEANPEEPQEVEKEGEKNQILFNGSSTLAPVISAIADQREDATTEVFVVSGGSGQGVKAVLEETTDFGMLARKVKDSEKEEIKDMKEYLVGIDALTLAIHPDNPLSTLKDGLTKDEIISIFSGEYQTWNQLDPALPEEEIVVIIRDTGGGAHEVFQDNIMGETEVKLDAIQAPSMGALVTNIMENPNAIGYASFGVVNQNADKVFTLKVDDIDASKENIQNGSYIIQRPLLLISSGEPTPEEQAFLDIVLGEKGQALVEEMGFVTAAQ